MEHWKFNVLLFVSKRLIKGRMWGKKIDEQMRYLRRERAGLKDWNIFFYLLL